MAINIDADLVAVHSMILALIKTHPDRQALRAAFEAISTEMQAEHIPKAEAVRTGIRTCVQRYLNHFDRLDAKSGKD